MDIFIRPCYYQGEFHHFSEIIKNCFFGLSFLTSFLNKNKWFRQAVLGQQLGSYFGNLK